MLDPTELRLPVLQIRIYPDLKKTLAYARMLEDAGAYLVAVHGRTREQKTAKECKANWDAIKVLSLLMLLMGVLRTFELTLPEVNAYQSTPRWFHFSFFLVFSFLHIQPL